jgi:hypothetical protein
MKQESKTIVYKFSHDEREKLGGELARSFSTLRGIENEFDGVKADYKAKTTSAEANIDRLSTNITNGFEMRTLPCWCVFRMKDKQKDWYLSESDAVEADPKKVVLTENMGPDDFQQELIEAESKFDAREELQLFQAAEGDRGILVVGRLAGKWFSALRVKIGKLELNERLDAEQKCFTQRSDAVATAVKRVNAWAKDNLKDLAEGFQAAFDKVAEENKERVE